VGVEYGSPVAKVSALIEQAVAEQDSVLPEPAPTVIFEDFGDSALIFDVYYWINAGADRDLRVIRSNVRFRIIELFRENDIVIAFPQRDVHLNGELKLTRPSEPPPPSEQSDHKQADR
jgi:small-conductance mechanosensitive channel